MVEYDVAIIGGGPAGLTAGIYASRYCMKTVIISKDVGGMANMSPDIENYPGYKGSGYDLMQKFFNQAKEFGSELIQREAKDINKEDDHFLITLSDQEVRAKSIILSSGTDKRKLNVPGEVKFLGKGVSYCATCDGSMFRDKTVCVVGGGNSAAGAALILSNVANKVYLIHRKDKLRCEKTIEKRLVEKENIDIWYNKSIREIYGDQFVDKVVFNEDDYELEVQGVFVEIGSIPKTDLFHKLQLNTDDNGYVTVDSEMKTNIPGIFAAGDAIHSKLKQIVVAAGQGAIAARSSFDYLETHKPCDEAPGDQSQ